MNMLFDKTRKLIGVTAPLVFAVGCGGSVSSTGNETEPDQGAATTTSVQTTAVSGRVADGYIRGAIICVDINENGNCDSDEPQTVSEAGGAYTLDIPEDATDKPILALVPPTAVDEDTGEAIGKELHFSTPGDKPTFLSPITTLVHQELKNNPNLDTDDAEAVVKETLGMPDDEDASLFTDYVAHSETGDEEVREKFEYLHQTARVLATMMGDIQEDVLEAAEANGLDVSGDPATQAAILQLVRNEVRDLLPEISAAVAEEISDRLEEGDGENSESESKPDFDPEKIADNLTPEDVSDEIVTQIEEVKSENPIERASMKELLTNGFYTLDVDCHHDDHYGPEDGIEEEVVDQAGIILNDDGSPGFVDLPEYCEAEYAFISLDGESGEIQFEDYFYNVETGLWEKEEYNDDDDDEHPHLFVLNNGQWVPMSEDGPTGKVEFTDDGAAILKENGGKIIVYANKKVLDDTSVLHHLKHRGADEYVARLVGEEELFPTGSEAYRLNIKRDTRLTVLFNWYAEDDQEGGDHCAQYAGNCNVIGIRENYQYIPVHTLATLQEGSLNGIVLSDMVYDHEGHHPIDVKMHADSTENTMPESGTLTWIKPGYYYHYPEDSFEPCPAPETNDQQEQKLAADGSEKDEHEEDMYQCVHPDGTTDYHQKLSESDKPAVDGDGSSTSENDDREDRVLAKSRWKLIDDSGVKMIEVEIPVTIRHRIDEKEMASLLLIEQNEFVRRGARFSDGSVDDEVGYSEAAFDTLQPIIEEYVSQ